jgi:signal transduction histidine kinase
MITQPDTAVGSPEQTKPVAAKRQWRWPQFVDLQARLTVPYILLTIAIAMAGTYIVTSLVTSSVRERFDNQLYETSRVAADGIVNRERSHLTHLRLLTFTEGVPEALARRDAAALRDLLWPLMLNNKMEFMTAVDRQGMEVVSLALDPQTGQYHNSSGADFSPYSLVANILNNASDDLGDKFVGLLPTAYGDYFFTSAPVRDSSGELQGVMMVGSNLDKFVVELKTQALADVFVLNLSGQLVASTFMEPPEGYRTIELSSAEANDTHLSLSREAQLYNRGFEIVYAPLIIRQRQFGVLGVALPNEYIFATGATSRNLFIGIFAVATVAIIAIGTWLARSISQPIVRLRNVSREVAAGNLEQTTHLHQPGEIGELAHSFDVMTLRLRERTAEAARLYAESIQRNKELEQINAKLQTAQQQLVQSEKLAAIGQLTAGIVHDVKNPLAVVIGMADEIRDHDLDPKEVRESLKTIRDSARRASAIVTDLLKFARQSVPEAKPQDIIVTVTTALRLTDYLIRKARVVLIKDIPAAPITVIYDATQIEQVLINLIQNAVQAMPNGGELRINVNQVEGVVAIAVHDTGVGIPPQNLAKIFDPFFTTKPAGEGTGLGLSVSYGIVANHGGRITVNSEGAPGQGTTFTVLLPVEPPAELSNKETRE